MLSDSHLGSIYLPVMIAETHNRMTVRRISGDQIASLSRLIRFPTGTLLFFLLLFLIVLFSTDSYEGKMIKSTIIPALDCVRKKYPISVRLVFNKVFLDSIFYVNVLELDCMDIQESDHFFDKFPYK